MSNRRASGRSTAACTLLLARSQRWSNATALRSVTAQPVSRSKPAMVGCLASSLMTAAPSRPNASFSTATHRRLPWVCSEPPRAMQCASFQSQSAHFRLGCGRRMPKPPAFRSNATTSSFPQTTSASSTKLPRACRAIRRSTYARRIDPATPPARSAFRSSSTQPPMATLTHLLPRRSRHARQGCSTVWPAAA